MKIPDGYDQRKASFSAVTDEERQQIETAAISQTKKASW